MKTLHGEIFQELKKLLMSTQVLILLDFDKDFLVCINVSKEDIGGGSHERRNSSKL
jgi:hypothetical protein